MRKNVLLSLPKPLYHAIRPVQRSGRAASTALSRTFFFKKFCVGTSLLYTKAHAFGVRIVRAYQHVSREQREYVLSKQLLRCGTSIGANIAEANGAISDADFSARISIAYKEMSRNEILAPFAV